MADDPTTDESADFFIAPPEAAQKIIHALQNADEDDVSGYAMIDLAQFTYKPVQPTVGTIDPLRAKDISVGGNIGHLLDNCSEWPIGGG